MGRPRATAELSSPPKRQAILDAALALFAERGYHGTAVPEVAARAGVGAGTLYRYFASKEALVNELFQTWKQRLAAALLEGFPTERPVREQFRELWRRLNRFAADHPRALAFLELHHHRDYLDARSRAVETQLLGALRAFLVEAQKKRALRDGRPEVLMAIVYGAWVSLVRAGREGWLALDDEALDETAEALWRAIRR